MTLLDLEESSSDATNSVFIVHILEYNAASVPISETYCDHSSSETKSKYGTSNSSYFILFGMPNLNEFLVPTISATFDNVAIVPFGRSPSLNKYHLSISLISIVSYKA